MNLYFLKFLGKINRIVKTYPDLTGYTPYIINDIGPIDATHFPYNDGIKAYQTYNFSQYLSPDYAIIVDDQGSVTSRWYVEELTYRANGQTRVSFMRDVLADFKEDVLSATSLIQKATVSDNDPAIYNQEAISFNQIKQDETLLKDQTKIAWLVGYLSSDNSANKKYEATTSLQIQKTVSDITEWEFYRYINNDFVGAPKKISYNVKCNGVNSDTGYWLCQFAFNTYGGTQTDTRVPEIGYKQLSQGDFAYNPQQGSGTQYVTFESKVRGISGYTWGKSEIYSAILSKLGNFSSLDNTFITQVGFTHTADEEGELKGLDGISIYDSTRGKTYRVNVQTVELSSMSRYIPQKGTAIYNQIADLMAATGKTERNNITNVDDIYVKYYANKYRITLTEIENHNVDVTITASRHLLNDAPYSMFAIPYSGINYKIGANTFTSDPEAALAIARQLSLDLMSSGALYDLQLLPYCPRQDLIGTNYIDLRSAVAEEHKDYELIKDAELNNKSFILFCKQSSFTFDINESITITEKKVQNQCDMWRLCSPNYNGVFEFNAAKNNGVDYFNVDCTYRPYNPYIHINPNFKELYGNDFDDARGLVCSGDFSMPACTEKWLEYEAQNKNYQNSFDRSIQHLEIEQKYQRIGQIAGAVAGVGSGAVAGGAIGGTAGAIGGGVLSAAGGVADFVMGEQLRSEQIRYARDQFSFNLENIKAIPNSLAKISAFNKNNKIFPFLEWYSCTEIERSAFRDTLTFDGMTVNRIGRIIDFLRDGELQYIKARLIRCESLHDDQHIVDVIASEMEKGAYYDTRSD